MSKVKAAKLAAPLGSDHLFPAGAVLVRGRRNMPLKAAQEPRPPPPGGRVPSRWRRKLTAEEIEERLQQRIERRKEMEPELQEKYHPNNEPFPVGQKKIYLPDITVTLMHTPDMPPTWAKFAVPLRFNKLDLRDYLYHLYGVETRTIRSFLTQPLFARTQAGSLRDVPGKRQVYLPEAKKFMLAELVQPFLWPKNEDAERREKLEELVKEEKSILKRELDEAWAEARQIIEADLNRDDKQREKLELISGDMEGAQRERAMLNLWDAHDDLTPGARDKWKNVMGRIEEIKQQTADSEAQLKEQFDTFQREFFLKSETLERKNSPEYHLPKYERSKRMEVLAKRLLEGKDKWRSVPVGLTDKLPENLKEARR